MYLFRCDDFDSLGRFLSIYECCTNKQVATFIKSIWGIALRRDFQKKNRPEKFPYIATNDWIVLAVSRSAEYFFASNSPLFRKSDGEKKNRSNYKAFCFLSKHKKLEPYEIKGCNLRWFESYLSNSKQFVTYGDKQTNIENITCGVPQGSILGP